MRRENTLKLCMQTFVPWTWADERKEGCAEFSAEDVKNQETIDNSRNTA